MEILKEPKVKSEPVEKVVKYSELEENWSAYEIKEEMNGNSTDSDDTDISSDILSADDAQDDDENLSKVHDKRNMNLDYLEKSKIKSEPVELKEDGIFPQKLSLEEHWPPYKIKEERTEGLCDSDSHHDVAMAIKNFSNALHVSGDEKKMKMSIKPEPAQERSKYCDNKDFGVNWLSYEVKKERNERPNDLKLGSINIGTEHINEDAQGSSVDWHLIEIKASSNYSKNESSETNGIEQDRSAKKHPLEVYIKEKSYHCYTCDKAMAFALRSALTSHLKIHSKDKLNRCDICQKAFVHRTSLRSHLRIHSKEKPYTCEFCKKSFSQSSNWKTHLRVHTKEKPFNCSICDKAYGQYTSLKYHLKTHSKAR